MRELMRLACSVVEILALDTDESRIPLGKRPAKPKRRVTAIGPLRTFIRPSVRSMLFTSLLACSPSKGGLGLAAALMFGGRRCAPTSLRPGPEAQAFARHKQSTGLFVSGLSASVPRPRRRARFVRFALYAQTPAASQFTIRAAREAAGPALLGATALASAVALARRRTVLRTVLRPGSASRARRSQAKPAFAAHMVACHRRAQTWCRAAAVGWPPPRSKGGELGAAPVGGHERRGPPD